VEGPALGEWKADGALHLWLKDKARRVEHKEKHKKHKRLIDDDSSEDDCESEVFCLEEWENWLDTIDSDEDEDSDKHNSSDNDSDICILD